MRIIMRRSNNLCTATRGVAVEAEYPAWWAYIKGCADPVAEVRTNPPGRYYKYGVYSTADNSMYDGAHTLTQARHKIAAWPELEGV